MRRLVFAAAAALVLCGTALSAAPKPFAPKAPETAGQLMSRMTLPLRTTGCNTQLKGLFFSGFGEIPDAGCTSLRGQLGKFAKPEGKVFGTGAVVDALTGHKDDLAAVPMVLDKGTFRLPRSPGRSPTASAGRPTSRSTGSSSRAASGRS